VVVDLSIENDPNGVGFIGERLMPASKIDDAQAPVSERGALISEYPCIVWPAMGKDVAHPGDALTVIEVEPIEGNEAGDSAHAQPSRPGSVAAVDPGSRSRGSNIHRAAGELPSAFVARGARRRLQA
jgi:hypothetical protein